MKGCYIGPDLGKGLTIFKDKYRATEDFFQASVLALDELNKSGIPITKSEFDVYLRDNFITIITQDAEYFRFKSKKTGNLLERVQKELGIGGRYAVGRPGTNKVGKTSLNAQDSLQRVKDGYLLEDSQLEGLTIGEQVIVRNLLDGRNYQDNNLLEQALKSLKQIRKEGVAELDRLREKEAADQEKKNEMLASDLTRLTLKQQKLQKLAGKMNTTGEGDIEALKDKAADAGIKVQGEDIKTIANNILIRLNRMAQPPFSQTSLRKVVSGASRFLVNTFHDANSAIGRMSRRGNDSTVGGIGKTMLYDSAKDSEQDIIGLKEEHVDRLGEIIANAYNIKIPDYSKKTRGALRRAEFLQSVLTEHAIASARKFNTPYSDAFNNPIILSKGDLMQLYADAINPDALAGMERNGLDLQKLNTLVNDTDNGLTEEDKVIAMSLVTDFYPEMWKKENEVHRRLYYTNMPRIHNYAGPLSYVGESVEDVVITGETLTDMSKMTEVLVNTRSRGEQERPLDLNRNIYGNAIYRMINSAKFVGGAETWVSTTKALNSVRAQIENGFSPHYYHKIKNHLDGLLSMRKGNQGFPSVLTWIKSRFTAATLGAKVKLMLNQVTSMSTWAIEASFWRGFGKKIPELGTTNITKLLYDASPAARDRYKGINIIALDAQIESASYDAKILLEGRNKFNKMTEKGMRWAMAGIAAGDEAGVFWAGTAYFKGEYLRLREEGKSIEEAKRQAVNNFVRKFSATQQSFSPMDRSDIQNTPWGGLFTMFQTTPFQYGRITMDAVDQLARRARGRESKGSVGYNTLRILMFHNIAGMMYYMITQGAIALAYGEWDEEEWKELMYSALFGPWTTAMFIIGDILEGIKNKLEDKPYETELLRTSAIQNLEKANKLTLKAIKLASKPYRTYEDEKKLEEMKHEIFILMGATAGLPAVQGEDIWNAVDRTIENEDMSLKDMFLILGWSEYTVDDKGKLKKKTNYGPIDNKEKNSFKKKKKSVLKKKKKTTFKKKS